MARPKKENQAEDLDFEIRFYENILKKRPNFIQALITLADSYTKKGFYKEGLKIDKKLAKLRPADPIIFYNLSCSYSLLKRNKSAFEALKKAIGLGYKDFTYMQQDPDLDNLRRDKRYGDFISRYLSVESSK